MNQVTEYRRGGLEAFKAEILAPERKADLFAALPAHVKPERFERNLHIALTQNPRLLELDPIDIFNEVCKVAALGLMLDPQLGEAYLIESWDGRARKKVPQIRVGYRGLVKLARQSGDVRNVYSHEVCANDRFFVRLGDSKKLDHEPDFMADRGAVIAYYAVVVFSDGATDFEIMPIRQIHDIRNRSDGWRAFQEGKIKSTPWGTDEGEMAKKTVIRRLVKRLPQSPELADALRIEDVDYQDAGEAAPAKPTLASRFSGRPAIGSDGFDRGHVQRHLTDARGSRVDVTPTADFDRETGEVVESRHAPADTQASAQGRRDRRMDADAAIDDRAGRSSPGGSHVDGDGGEPTNIATAGASSAPQAQSDAPRLPRKTMDDYARALAPRADAEALEKAARAFWPQHGGWPTAHPEDLAVAQRIMDVHKQRVANKTSAEDAKAFLDEFIADSFGEDL